MQGDKGSAPLYKLVERIAGEARRFVVMFVYLWLMFGLFVLLEAIVGSRMASAWVVITRLLRTWRRRELHRRELSVLSSRDFGDLPVPQSLINEEIRRWPRQKWNQQWSQVNYKRGHPCDGIGRTR